MNERPRDPRLRDAFGAETDTELEAQVPGDLITAAWPRLAAELAAQPARRPRGNRVSLAIAAAFAVMITLTGWLAMENRQLRRHHADAPIVAVAAAAPRAAVTAGELVRRLALLPPDTPVLTAAEAEHLVRRGRPLLYALVRGSRLDAVVADGVTAAEALVVLRSLDADTPIPLGGAAAGRS